MTMVYLANVQSIETDWGIECYTPHAHVSVDYPYREQPDYVVIAHLGAGTTRRFPRFDQAMDYASRCLKQSEPMI
jgi:hypothetical protein